MSEEKVYRVVVCLYIACRERREEKKEGMAKNRRKERTKNKTKD